MEDPENTPNPSELISEVPTTDNPSDFFSSFLKSNSYKLGFDSFYEGKTLAEDVTEEEKRKVFEESERGKTAFLNFAQRELRFRYNPDNFDSETKNQIEDYIYIVKYLMRTLRGGSRDEILDADHYRSVVHDKTAKKLAENNYVTTEKLGRTFARIILIDQRLDSFENASIDDLERIRRLIGG